MNDLKLRTHLYTTLGILAFILVVFLAVGFPTIFFSLCGIALAVVVYGVIYSEVKDALDK